MTTTKCKAFPNLTTKLSNPRAAAAVSPPTGDYLIRDINNRTTGLALRIYASGVKSWIVQKKLARQPRKYVIGQFPDVTYTQAVTESVGIADKIKKGIDPRLEARQQEIETETLRTQTRATVQVAFTEYRKQVVESLSPTTIRDYTKAADRLASGAVWKMPVLEIKGPHLAAEYRRVKTLSSKGKASTTGEAQASSIMRSLRAALKHKLLSMEVEAADPFVRLNKLVPGWYRTKARTNIVAKTDGDLERWWKGVEQLRGATAHQAKDSPTIADYLILSLLFGGRLSETLSLKWENVSMRSKVVRFPAEVTKSGRDHLIPFGPYAESILQRRFDENLARDDLSKYVFNASRSSRAVDGVPGKRTHIKFPKKAIERVGSFSDMKFTSHDIRRTFSSLFAELPVSDATVERALNHAAQTTARRHYIQSRLEPLRQNYILHENAVLKEAKVNATVAANTSAKTKVSSENTQPKVRRKGALA